jgi:UDP-N-acetylmuramoyl-L-alanyl-D-glutamate--2,6-diaminopimelate ligase
MGDKDTEGHVKLSDLLQALRGGADMVYGDRDREISSVEYNSKRVTRNALFVAIEGFQSDGHAYIRDAVDRGAAAVVLSRRRISEFSDLTERGVTLIVCDNSRSALSKLSSSFFHNPTSRVPVFGITGTNGKTSVTFMLESILSSHGYSPGVIGTVNYRWKGNDSPAPNTTPESRDLQELIFRMIHDGVDIVIMEVSSHALELNRVDDIDFDIAVFTNLTRDHLDFHRTFDDYFNAKKKIFQVLEESCKRERYGIVNADDDYGRIILNQSGSFSYPFMSYGIENDADLFSPAMSIENSIDGIRYVLEKPGGGEIRLKLSGRFNVYNSLCAMAVSHAWHIPFDTVREGLSSIRRIPGRFDRIFSSLGFTVIVDYAHTDDALLKLLQSVRGIKHRRLITIFGCGGNRDSTKRPLMGRVAVENSDWVIVTSDNPRREDPDRIVEDIVAGLENGSYEIIPERERAIRRGIYMADRDDIVVIAGKGHENYQIIDTERIHFDDREVAHKYIREREGV